VIGWSGQVRDDHAIPWSAAFAKLWLHTALGGALLAAGWGQPAALPYLVVFAAGGLVLSIPLCVLTSWPGLGRALQRVGIGRLPEETAPPAALRRRASLVETPAAPAR
jgi:membrane glycosyltransferase